MRKRIISILTALALCLTLLPSVTAANGEGSMQIFVKLPTGRTLTLNVEPGSTISEVKTKIREKAGTPSDQQVLTYNNRQLNDGDTLADYNIQRESTLFMSIKGNLSFDLNGYRLIINGSNTSVRAEADSSQEGGGILTLDNTTISCDDESPIDSSDLDVLKIVLNGRNKVESMWSTGIIANSLVFSGDGSIDILGKASYNWPADCLGDITVNSGDVVMQGVDSAVCIDGTLTVNGGTLTLIATSPDDTITLDCGLEDPKISLGQDIIMITSENPSGADAVLTDINNVNKISKAKFIKFFNKNVAVTFAPGANGTGAQFEQNKVYGEDLTLPNAGFTRRGYTQIGWTTSDGGAKIYDLGGAYTGNEAVTLYPAWKAESYAITYRSLAAGENLPSSHTYGTETRIPNPVCKYFTFNGWLINGGTAAVKSLTLGAEDYASDITLEASWTPDKSGRHDNSSVLSYEINIAKTEHGSVSADAKSAVKGSTVNVSANPDNGYELETVTVTDSIGNELKLTDNGSGKYSFTMPGSSVKVSTVFAEDNSVLNFFYDVPNDAYYYEAVKWAAGKGITGGVGNYLFAPNSPCTRAQIVTFMWRAAGSPVVNYAMNMTDVPSDAYYTEAVRWALSEGITVGTSTDKFSPDAVCTRAHGVTFLFRAFRASASGASGFSDVPADAYYANAVKWAVDNGITNGIGGGLFAPDNTCTRAQIVTLLWRAYNR